MLQDRWRRGGKGWRMGYLAKIVEGLRSDASRRRLLKGGGAMAAGWLMPWPGVGA